MKDDVRGDDCPSANKKQSAAQNISIPSSDTEITDSPVADAGATLVGLSEGK